jgi:hypothetical protein
MVGVHHTRRDVIVLGGAVIGSLTTAISGNVANAAAPTAEDAASFERFMSFSSEATGFSTTDLKQTRQDTVYYGVVREVVGGEELSGFLAAYGASGMAGVLNSDEHGPVARNIIKLWYSATWERMPEAWQRRYGKLPSHDSFIISADAYTTGLLWAAIGVNPPGANAPGFGTWSHPPSKT